MQGAPLPYMAAAAHAPRARAAFAALVGSLGFN